MPKNYNLRKLILEVLENDEISKKRILEVIRSKSGIGTSDKTFNESLMALLREGQIYIADYDFTIYDGVKRIQSIRPEGIVFGVSRMDFVEIETILKQMESKDHEEVYKASKNLKRVFRRKIDELQNEGTFNNPNGADTLFNQTIFYMNSMGEEQKRSFRNKLAWGLSNNKGSLELFKNIVSFVQSQE
ncbi:hypothetical protein [Methanobacterium formicicum]|uniref:Uncharacterized protein n=1 Tax=Methanobacterium formicicum (strain DSM 3637 / PP1) TaxID=1204725 RepID=K2RCI2_METFP|nr:hypothetical protein [Methanobacterium formicicum]EKF86014.1 hypothetical protein A994_05991 [Methanobacterium formicicum DSM 3637]